MDKCLIILLPSRYKIISLKIHVNKSKTTYLVQLEEVPVRLDRRLFRRVDKQLVNYLKTKNSIGAQSSIRNKSTTYKSVLMKMMDLQVTWRFQLTQILIQVQTIRIQLIVSILRGG